MSQFAKTYSNYLEVKDELSKVSWSHNLVLMSKVKDENTSPIGTGSTNIKRPIYI